MEKTKKSVSPVVVVGYSPKNNPVRDYEKVVPNLSVDIGEIMNTGVVASTGDTTPYTKETEISEIGHYVKDKIQCAIAAMKLNRSISEASKVSPSIPSNPSNPEGAN